MCQLLALEEQEQRGKITVNQPKIIVEELRLAWETFGVLNSLVLKHFILSSFFNSKIAYRLR
jgi:hypothetical protein